MSYFHRSVTSNLGNLLTRRQLFRAMFHPFSIQKQLSSVKQITYQNMTLNTTYNNIKEIGLQCFQVTCLSFDYSHH